MTLALDTWTRWWRGASSIIRAATLSCLIPRDLFAWCTSAQTAATSRSKVHGVASMETVANGFTFQQRSPGMTANIWTLLIAVLCVEGAVPAACAHLQPRWSRYSCSVYFDEFYSSRRLFAQSDDMRARVQHWAASNAARACHVRPLATTTGLKDALLT